MPNMDIIKIKPNLFDSPSIGDMLPPSSLAACLNAHGLYHIEQFVLRLSPVVHERVDSAVGKSFEEVSYDELVAYSTYLHETVHWWQHIGSICGLITSLCYPAQTHKTFDSLKKISGNREISKPIMLWAEKQMLDGLDHTDRRVRYSNLATNYIFDLECYRIITMRPESLSELRADKYFESVGHSFYVAYDSAITSLAGFLDPEYSFFPDPDVFHEEFTALKEARVKGFYHGSPITITPISGVDILEGQARFVQLQFLSCLMSEHMALKDVAQEGYLDGVYGKAFTAFQSILGEDIDHIGSPLIGLFLLICDLSLNPAEGFLLKFENVSTMIEDCDPNYRFIRFCQAAKKNIHLLRGMIVNYSKDEYIEVVRILSDESGLVNFYVALGVLKEWVGKGEAISELLGQQKDFSYSKDDLSLRVIFSHYLALNLDRLECPEFFCWAGYCKTHAATTDEYSSVWLRNLSIFGDKADEDGIFPRGFPFRDKNLVQEVFNNFYATNLMYDMTRQWVAGKGEFKYDYGWLANASKHEGIKQRVKENFKVFYGVHPDEIRISD